MLRVFVLAACMLATDAFASDWQLIEKTTIGSAYIDRASQRRDMTVYIAWVKSVSAKPQRLHPKGATAYYTQKLELVYMDCEKRNYLIKKSVYSSENGATVASDDGTAAYEPVVPDSSSEVRYTAMCGNDYSSFKALRDKGIEYRPLEQPKSKWNPFSN